MIFELALHRPNKSRLYFNSHSDFSGSGFSSYVHKKWRARIAFNLPQVCRQIYAESATLICSTNKFSFATYKAMSKWLSKRLPAQLEAIKHLEVLERDDDEEREDILQQLKDYSCPNLRSLTKSDATAEAIAPIQAFAQEEWRGKRGYISTDDEELWQLPTEEEILSWILW